MATTVYGNQVKAPNYNFYFKSWFAYTVDNSSPTVYKITLTSGVYCTDTNVGWDNITNSIAGTGQTTKSKTASYQQYGSSHSQTYISSFTWSWNKGTSAANKTIKSTMSSSRLSASTASKTFTVPALQSWTVSYNANGGSGAPGSQTKYYGQTLKLSTTVPTKSGYTFLGWSTSSTATSATYAAGANYTGNAGLTLYAVWRKAITITFDANGGSNAPAAQTGYAYNSSTSTSISLSATTPVRTGYTFLGWAESSAASTPSYSPSTAYTFSSSTTLYAVWQTVSYALSYDYAGGSVSTANPATYNIETPTFTLIEPTRSYYRFAGWTGTGVSSPTKNLSIPVGSIGDRSFTANWERTYVAPKLKINYSKRDSLNHNNDDSGTVPNIAFEWVSGTDEEIVGTVTPVTPTKYSVTFTNQNDPTEVYTATNINLPQSPVNAYFDSITLMPERAYDVVVTLILDDYDDISSSDYISKAYFTVDVNSDGTAIGLGIPVLDSTDPNYESGVISDMDVTARGKLYIVIDENASISSVDPDEQLDAKLYASLTALGWI